MNTPSSPLTSTPKPSSSTPTTPSSTLTALRPTSNPTISLGQAKQFSISKTRSVPEMASSSASSTKGSWMYDVFLSFRGQDTRNNFTDHLYMALNRAGVRTFRDSEELRKGEDKSPALIGAIQGSRISIVVFSENYAGSSWCLDELQHIMECKKTRGQMVHPIFYHVTPSDVRHQKGSFDKAFEKHEARETQDKISGWRSALQQAANLSGSTFEDGQ